MDPIAERIERYLADRKEVFEAEQLSKRLEIRKSKLVNLLLLLNRANLVRLHFVDDRIFVSHTGWRGHEVRKVLRRTT